jgi:hypothetical protein
MPHRLDHLIDQLFKEEPDRALALRRRHGFVATFYEAGRCAQVQKVEPSLRAFIVTWKSKPPSSPLGASREVALSSCRMYSRSRVARRSYWRRPETTYRRSITYLSLSETAGYSPTDPSR